MQMPRRKLPMFVCIALIVACAPFCAAQEARQQSQQQSSQRDQYRDQAQTALRDQQEKGTESFPGKISEKHGKYYLEKAFSRASYELVDTWDTKRFVNKKVRITGWLDSEHNILHVTAITKTP
jgi:outer membrane biogenesis lipoprotein LolB